MVDKQYGKYILVCDVCDKEITGLDDFQAVVFFKDIAGWKSKRVKDKCNNWIWEDICEDCKNK